mmetsp:Transcript_18155/g.23422  ORF Transcript_18155/g.23422 Transcript_18155/m.23422 type:complete len:96 (-) Transcript_18155:115-402(-)
MLLSFVDTEKPVLLLSRSAGANEARYVLVANLRGIRCDDVQATDCVERLASNKATNEVKAMFSGWNTRINLILRDWVSNFKNQGSVQLIEERRVQ